MNEEQPILKFEHFGFKYNAQTSPTLYDINLEVRKGEKILIAGPSGCGKSTLIHCINGLIPFSYKGEMTGSLEIDGKETKNQSLFDISMHVGTVLQDSDAQFVGLTVAEDIAFAMENDLVPVDELHRRVSDVASIVDMQDFLTHAPGELSGGQKQRVSMAGILVDDVDIMLFDEPLANLDPKTGKTAIELIDKMHKETDTAVIIVEHRLEDVLHRNVDRIVLMSEGRIVADMTPDELLSENLLVRHGIREPLYVSALKYANVNITPDMKASSIDTLALNAGNIHKVQEWFRTVNTKEKKLNDDIILQVDNISFEYANGHKALNDISLKVKRGEMLAIVGTNGAGKSTLSKVICGFESETSGKIYFDGTDMGDYSIKERADHIGYVMQNPNQMISKVMIYDEIALGLLTRGKSEEEIKSKTEQVLKICGLWKKRKWPISALSFGQKKRVTIASILALEPEIIILDEPTAGQDYRHYTEIMEFLKMLNDRGITVIMVTHDMHLMLEYADRVLVLSKGRIIADDTGANILTEKEIVKQASLKETSLYDLAIMCDIPAPREFVRRFIDYENQMNIKKEEINE